jgi:hypothetical protein
MNYCTNHGQYYSDYCAYCGYPFKIGTASSSDNMAIGCLECGGKECKLYRRKAMKKALTICPEGSKPCGITCSCPIDIDTWLCKASEELGLKSDTGYCRDKKCRNK